MNKLRIAFIGCGKIADQHVQAMQRIAGHEIVAVCDREELMARQLAERFGISGVFSDARAMLEAVSPDVVHITTPPQGHFALAKLCLEAGSHIYLEKPFTVTAPEAEEIIDCAKKRGLKITAGHNYQFTLEMMEMRKLVADGFLGGKPIVHVESHWGYDLGDTNYVGPLLGNRNHWVRQLPGKLFHNLISHGIARLAEFLGDEVEVTAHAHQSDYLRSLGGAEVMDELRVVLKDKGGTTAFFCFSTQIKPGINSLRVCGAEQSFVADLNSGTVVRFENKSCKSYLIYFLPPLWLARQHLHNAWTNVMQFLRGQLHQDFGMKELIERFYECVRNDGEPPIPYREILLTARIMDKIFAQVYPVDKAPGTAAQEKPMLEGVPNIGGTVRKYAENPA